MNDEKFIRVDRMRFTKNTQSSGLAILAIVFNVLYFISLYSTNVGSYYYNILIGASILYNLIFMLAAFLSSEGVKNYVKKYSYLLLALAAGQIVRIFIIPIKARGAMVAVGTETVPAMSGGQFTFLVICLIASAACLAAAAIINLNKCSALEEHGRALAKTA